VYYQGGAGIDRFRGVAGGPGPEDWIGSVSALPPELLPAGADPLAGVSRLEDGESLRDVVRADPENWLGRTLAAAYAGETGLLVKLLDAGERLPVHCHPNREVAQRKLGSPFGKTEGWVILGAAPDATIWIGFERDVSAAQLRSWIDTQDVGAMLAAMNRIEVRPGDVFYLPAGAPHSVGAGILLLELQEPTSFSILAEYLRFGLDEAQATLALGWEDAIACFDLGGGHEAIGRHRSDPEKVAVVGDAELWRLFPDEASQFFQAYRLRVDGKAELPAPSFRVVIVEHGSGELTHDSGAVRVTAGETWVVPYASGALRARGRLDLLLCEPPRVVPGEAIAAGAQSP
jgi:mannose-6-phosphate isomerase